MRAFISLALVVATTINALPRQQEHPVARGLTAQGGAPLEKRQFRLIPVVVGGPQDSFVPNSLTAAVGDVIQFQFSNGNHTVTQSTETTPCQPLQQVDPLAIHSGHIPFQDGQLAVGTFNMPVTGVEPMFLYCATGPHCQEGQVMVVNPTSPEQVVNFVKAAAGAPANIDGTTVVGGAVGTINLEAAAFVPAPPAEQGAPGGAPPPGAAPENAVSTAVPSASPSSSPAADGVAIPVTIPLIAPTVTPRRSLRRSGPW